MMCYEYSKLANHEHDSEQNHEGVAVQLNPSTVEKDAILARKNAPSPYGMSPQNALTKLLFHLHSFLLLSAV